MDLGGFTGQWDWVVGLGGRHSDTLAVEQSSVACLSLAWCLAPVLTKELNSKVLG